MLLAAFAGILLYALQYDIVSKRGFVRIRRYGLWHGSRALVQAGWAKRFTLFKGSSLEGWMSTFGVLLVPVSGFLAGMILPSAVETLLPKDYRGAYLGHVLNQTALIGGIGGMLVAVYYWLNSLRYAANPPLELPTGLRKAGRNRLVAHIYWVSHIRVAAFFAGMYPVLFFGVALGNLSGSSSTSSSARPDLYKEFLVLSVLVAFAVLSIAPALTVAGLIERRLITARVCHELCTALTDSKDKAQARRGGKYPSLMTDPHVEIRRNSLAVIAEHLEEAAWGLDARQIRGYSPHPISTLLRAVSRSIRQYLKSERSLRKDIPNDLRDTLAMTIILLSVEPGPENVQQLAKRCSAFDSHGSPAVELKEKPPSRVAIFVGRTLATIPRIALALTSLAGVTALVIAVILTLLHRMNVSELLRYLH